MSAQSFVDQLPVIGGLFDDTDQQALAQLQKNQALYSGLQLPQFQQYNPEQYSVVGQYDPTQMQASTVQEDPSLYNTQLSVLNNLAGLSQTGLSPVDAQQIEQARELGGQTMHSGDLAALQNASARGMAGSGMEFGMREAANQAGAQQAMQGGLQAAAQQAQQRALYNQMMGGMASGLQGQQIGLNTTNSNIMNRINELNTQNQNQAQQYNLGNAQNVSNANVTNRNQATQYNNSMAQQSYQDALSKANGQSGANTAMAGGYAAQNAANNSARNANMNLVSSGAAMALNGGSGGGGSGSGGKSGDGLDELDWFQ